MSHDVAIRVLLLADTHLGFDQPVRPRVERRRRGPDFFANTRLALAPALRGEVDLVVHLGLQGEPTADGRRAFGAQALRDVTPATMTLTLARS